MTREHFCLRELSAYGRLKMHRFTLYVTGIITKCPLTRGVRRSLAVINIIIISNCDATVKEDASLAHLE